MQAHKTKGVFSMAQKQRFGRTNFNQGDKSFWDALRTFDFKSLKNFKFKDLTKKQRMQIMLGTCVLFFLLMIAGFFMSSNEKEFVATAEGFVKASAQYDVQKTAKFTTSAAHQLVIGQTDKMKQTKARNYKTKVNTIETKIVSQNGASMIGTSRVTSTEQMGVEQPIEFTHLFVWQEKKTGASWKISNLMEAEAKRVNKESTPKN